MYESESDEKHLDFIAANAPTVSIYVIRSFCVAIRVQYATRPQNCPFPTPMWRLNPEGEGRVQTLDQLWF